MKGWGIYESFMHNVQAVRRLIYKVVWNTKFALASVLINRQSGGECLLLKKVGRYQPWLYTYTHDELGITFWCAYPYFAHFASAAFGLPA